MSNWGTMVQVVSDDTRSLVSSDRIKRYICEAMRLQNSERLWFMDGTTTIPFKDGKKFYEFGKDIPDRIGEIIGDRIWVSYGSDITDKIPCFRATRDRMNLLTSYEDEGDPVFWQQFRNGIEFWPIPTDRSGTYTVDFVENVTVPTYEYTGGAYVFSDEEKSAIGDSWTNSWLSHEKGYEMTKHKVLSLCFSNLGDNERATSNMLQWLEMQKVLRAMTDSREGVNELEPRFF